MKLFNFFKPKKVVTKNPENLVQAVDDVKNSKFLDTDPIQEITNDMLRAMAVREDKDILKDLFNPENYYDKIRQGMHTSNMHIPPPKMDYDPYDRTGSMSGTLPPYGIPTYKRPHDPYLGSASPVNMLGKFNSSSDRSHTYKVKTSYDYTEEMFSILEVIKEFKTANSDVTVIPMPVQKLHHLLLPFVTNIVADEICCFDIEAVDSFSDRKKLVRYIPKSLLATLVFTLSDQLEKE